MTAPEFHQQISTDDTFCVGSPTDEETNSTPYEQISTSSPIQEETTEPGFSFYFDFKKIKCPVFLTWC